MTMIRLSYVGFWQRFASLLLDGLIILPVGLLIAQLRSHSHLLFWFDKLIPGLLLAFFYDVYFVKRFGATPGKMIMGICIVKVDGAPVGWKEALLRYAVNLVFIVVSGIAYSVAANQISDTEYD